MKNLVPVTTDVSQRHSRAEELVARAFKNAGWRVSRQPAGKKRHRADLLVRKKNASYVVEIKAGVEGRSDRLIPLWSQGCLQASQVAQNHPPLVVVAAPKVAPRVAQHILQFAREYAPDVAAGVVDFSGLRMFHGTQLEVLNAEASSHSASARSVAPEHIHLFSDLNQWMLKVLLAPELPDNLLSAPRGQYHNASQLARAANVSVMSAYRFVQQLQREGYLHESAPYLVLVRREELFRRWQASALRSTQELSMRFLLGNGGSQALRKMLDSGRAYFGLFAAAEALGFGHVRGVPPHVYIRSLRPSGLAAWKNLVPAKTAEKPDLIVRQADVSQSISRGAVRPNGLATTDILQVWLDVSAHPSRGHEQAQLIRRRLLDVVIKGSARG